MILEVKISPNILQKEKFFFRIELESRKGKLPSISYESNIKDFGANNNLINYADYFMNLSRIGLFHDETDKDKILVSKHSKVSSYIWPLCVTCHIANQGHRSPKVSKKVPPQKDVLQSERHLAAKGNIMLGGGGGRDSSLGGIFIMYSVKSRPAQS